MSSGRFRGVHAACGYERYDRCSSVGFQCLIDSDRVIYRTRQQDSRAEWDRGCR